jgi:hypothetical protein
VEDTAEAMGDPFEDTQRDPNRWAGGGACESTTAVRHRCWRDCGTDRQVGTLPETGSLSQASAG